MPRLKGFLTYTLLCFVTLLAFLWISLWAKTSNPHSKPSFNYFNTSLTALFSSNPNLSHN